MDNKHSFFKNFLIIILCFFNCFIVKGQDVLVNLKIEWKKELNQFNFVSLKNKDSILIPYLKIEFINASNNSIYFKNFFDSNYKFAPAGVSLISNHKNFEFKNKNFLDINKYEEECYIELKINNNFNQFLIYSDTLNHVYSFKNEKFSQIKELFKVQTKLNELKSNKKLECFKIKNKSNISYEMAVNYLLKKGSLSKILTENDVREEKIMNNFYSNFVFLEPNEKKIYKVDLSAFYLIKGKYVFFVDKEVLDGKISVLSSSSEKEFYQNVDLPSSVGNYILYKGKIISNSVLLKTE